MELNVFFLPSLTGNADILSNLNALRLQFVVPDHNLSNSSSIERATFFLAVSFATWF